MPQLAPEKQTTDKGNDDNLYHLVIRRDPDRALCGKVFKPGEPIESYNGDTPDLCLVCIYEKERRGLR